MYSPSYRVTGDVDAVGAEDVESIHRKVLAGKIQEAHIKVDLELFRVCCRYAT